MTPNQQRMLQLTKLHRVFTSVDDGEIYLGPKGADTNNIEHEEGMIGAAQACLVYKWIAVANFKDFKPVRRNMRAARHGAHEPVTVVELAITEEGLAAMRGLTVETGGGQKRNAA